MGLVKKTVLLIGYNGWQARTLVLTLRVGGYVTRIVEDINEAINLIKMIPDMVNSIVMSGDNCHVTLKERLTALENHKISTPIYLVDTALTTQKDKGTIPKKIKYINILCCSNDQLLEMMDK